MQVSTSGVARKRPFAASAAMIGALVFLTASAPAAPQAKPETKSPTLYSRIGGYDAIASVVDDFLNQLQADEAFKRFGQGRSVNSLVRARQLIVDQICNLTGGPCVYIGRDMKPSHDGLQITSAEWESSNQKLVKALQKFKVGDADRAEFMAVIEKLRADIVEPLAKPAEKKPPLL